MSAVAIEALLILALIVVNGLLSMSEMADQLTGVLQEIAATDGDTEQPRI